MSIYYHNPKCSKSRAGLEVLKNSGVPFSVKEYLNEPLSNEELTELFSKLNIAPDKCIRRKEQEFKDQGLAHKSLSESQWIDVIIKTPKLLERPIYMDDHGAVIGRPTEALQEYLES